jgi:hypothetical protein
MNWKKHRRGNRGLDPRSSAAQFDGWARAVPPAPEPLDLAAPLTWLLSRGWRRHGLIALSEAPAAVRPS